MSLERGGEKPALQGAELEEKQGWVFQCLWVVGILGPGSAVCTEPRGAGPVSC